VLALLAGTGFALVVVAGGGGHLPGCDLASARPRVIGRDSFVVARDGAPLGAVPTTRNREPVALEQMSPWLPRATIAIEDRRFWKHGGVDPEGIARAALANLRAGHVVQGGSTITQQLVRDRYLAGRPPTLGRKLTEACLALELGRAWSKREVLGQYLNLVFYGHRAYGAEAAAWTYFSRSARDLTLAQAALLAGLPQAPSRYDPFKSPHATRERRDQVLAAMRAAGMITAAEQRAATASAVRLHPSRHYQRLNGAPFFDDVLRAVDGRYGAQRARHGGLRVETTLDPRLQRVAHQAIGGSLRQPSDPAAALVAIDPANGAIRAMAASTPGRRRLRFNLASQARRQAGSAFKVFTLTAAVERGIPLGSVWRGPRSLTIPSRICLNPTGSWIVHNFADETSGTMTLAQAIAHSVNTIFAQVVLEVGPARVVEVAHRMGVDSPLRPVCSITLGPEGVSPLEMTRAFATLAAHGVRHPAQGLQRVTTASGDVLAQLQPRGRRVLERGVADRVTSALRGVVLTGTGRAADIGRPVAGKTGTAEGFKDAWFCGYVPQLATCVWLGYPAAELPMHAVEGVDPVVGGSIPARIWHDFMAPAVAGRKVLPLPAPASEGRPQARPDTGGVGATR
jgi:penicillin-binding protein 1A